MPSPTAASPMTAEQSLVLTEFARACRTAARSVSLYPATHPSIQASLARVTAAAARLMLTKDVTLAVVKDTLMIDGRMPGRPDQAITELAGIMHDRLIGELRVERGADGLDWHALLMLLAQSPEDLLAAGGIAKAWEASGRQHFEIRAIDYAEMLRERDGPSVEWDQILKLCLHGDAESLDQAAITALLEMLGDSARFGELLERLQTIAEAGEPSVNARVAALLDLVTRMIDASGEHLGEEGRENVLRTVAGSTSRLTPDMLIALIEQARTAEGRSEVASDVVERIDEPTMAAFVARTVERQHGATERLAQALQLLVPDLEGRERVLELAKQEAQAGTLGQEPGFTDLWETAAQMLASYSDETYVSQEYARELSDAPTQALEVERVSDDPPERVKAWVGTVADAELRALDLTLLLDLLRIEAEAPAWLEIANVVGTEIEKRVQRGDMPSAQMLAYTLAQEASTEGRPGLREAAEGAMTRLADGPLARRVAAALRTAPDGDVEAYGRLCRTVGNRIITPLAEALMAEDNSRAIRRLREVLVGFGEAGRETVERLKSSRNPTARRTAIDMLRLFGGEALTDLTVMLDDGDPHVQRDAIRAIAQIGTDDAFAALQQALMSGKGSSATIPQQIISLREARAIPLLCYVLKHSKPRGPFVALHTQIMEALGALGQHPASIDALKAALYRGEWWAPGRTALLRRAAALALWRIGSPEALRVLERAAQSGGRRIRTAARIPAGTPPRRDREAS